MILIADSGATKTDWCFGNTLHDCQVVHTEGINPFHLTEEKIKQLLQESLLVREKGSGTHMLQEQAVAARGYSLDSFSRHSSISNFSIICDLVAMDHLITFAYEPISHCRNDLATFRVEDMEITGEFNLVYINRSVAEPKADLFLATC